MYCPWDVLQYVRSVLDGSYSEVMGPESYWLNTSETAPAMIHGFLGKTTDANESFERLLAGESIECLINETCRTTASMKTATTSGLPCWRPGI